MSDEKKLPEEELENLEISLDDIDNVSGGQGPVIHKTGDISNEAKKKA
jgi:hypothetical protein